MGSVSSYGRCPICGWVAEVHDDYGLEHIILFCRYCGYRYDEFALVDRKREKKTGKRCFKLTKDGKLIRRSREQIGYGSYRVSSVRGGACYGSIMKPLDEKSIESFRRRIDSPDVDKESSYLLSFDPTTKELTAAVGKIPDIREEWDGWDERLFPLPQRSRYQK
jgi:hypothetical protein